VQPPNRELAAVEALLRGCDGGLGGNATGGEGRGGWGVADEDAFCLYLRGLVAIDR
jgi:hypothetical protein